MSCKVYSPNKPVLISSVVDSFEKYDLNPPYQRDFAWKPCLQIDLFRSICDDIMLPPIHLVIKDLHYDDSSDHLYFVVDGKQRIQTIYNIFQDKIKLPVDGEKLFYSEIKKLSTQDYKKHKLHKLCKNIITKIKEYYINFVVYHPMTMEEQVVLFHRLNNSEKLKAGEQFFSDYHWSKLLTSYVRNKLPNWYENYIFKKSKDTAKHDLVALYLLSSLIGDLQSPNLNCRKVIPLIKGNGISLHNTASVVNNDIRAKFGNKKPEDFKSGLSKEILKTFNINYIDSLLSTLNTHLIFEWPKELVSKSKKKSEVVPLYFSLFLIEKLYKKFITKNQIRNPKTQKKLQIIYNDFAIWFMTENYNNTKNILEPLSRRGTTPNVIKLSFDKLQELWIKNNFKDVKKYKAPSKDFVKANQCEWPGCISTTDLEIDHVEPACSSDKEKFGTLCKFHNQLKGQLPFDELENFTNYVESVK